MQKQHDESNPDEGMNNKNLYEKRNKAIIIYHKYYSKSISPDHSIEIPKNFILGIG